MQRAGFGFEYQFLLLSSAQLIMHACPHALLWLVMPVLTHTHPNAHFDTHPQSDNLASKFLGQFHFQLTVDQNTLLALANQQQQQLSVWERQKRSPHKSFPHTLTHTHCACRRQGDTHTHTYETRTQKTQESFSFIWVPLRISSYLFYLKHWNVCARQRGSRLGSGIKG